MTWHDELVEVAQTPSDSKVRLVGVYNPPEKQALRSAIELTVEVTGPEKFAVIIYDHNPHGLAYEEPTAEDISSRYNQKVRKARNRLLATTFQDLRSVRKI